MTNTDICKYLCIVSEIESVSCYTSEHVRKMFTDKFKCVNCIFRIGKRISGTGNSNNTDFTIKKWLNLLKVIESLLWR